MQKEEKEGGLYAWTLNALIFFNEMFGQHGDADRNLEWVNMLLDSIHVFTKPCLLSGAN